VFGHNERVAEGAGKTLFRFFFIAYNDAVNEICAQAFPSAVKCYTSTFMHESNAVIRFSAKQEQSTHNSVIQQGMEFQMCNMRKRKKVNRIMDEISLT
jgi:hypothetical protein